MVFVFSNLFQLVWWSLGPSMLLRVALLHSFHGWVVVQCVVCTCVCACHVFCIPLSVSEHSECFHVLIIVNSAAMNVEEPVSFWIILLSRYMLRTGNAESHGNFTVSFLRNLHIVLHNGCTNLHSHLVEMIFDDPLIIIGHLEFFFISFLMKMEDNTIRYWVRVHKSFLIH